MSYDQLNSRLEIAESVLAERYHDSAATARVSLPPLKGIDESAADLLFQKIGIRGRGLFVTVGEEIVPLLHARLTLRLRAASGLADVAVALAEHDKRLDALTQLAIADVDRFINVMSNGALR